MALNYVTLICDLFDGSGSQISQGSVTFIPSAQLTDPADQELIPQAPVQAYFRAGLAAPQVTLLATDNANVQPSGWGWTVSFQNVPGNPASFNFFLPFSGGATQHLSKLSPVSGAVTMQAYLPLPGGTPSAGNVPIATGAGEASNWGSPGAASLPLTTLGDLLYENATPTAARLPGNTSAVKNFLTQTGTGTASAAPAWGPIAAGDVPTLNQSTTGNAATATNLAGGATLPDYLAPAAVALTFGPSIAVNAALGNAFNLTLTASTGTLANPASPVDGQVIRIRITQGAGGPFTLAYGTAYDFGAGTAPVLSTTAAKVDILGFEYVASISKWCYLGSGLGF